MRARSLPPPTISQDLLRDLGRWAGEDCCSSAASSTPDEIEAGHALRPGKAAEAQLHADESPKRSGAAAPIARPTDAARFAVGDRVRTKNIHPPTHTRLPRYVRGHVGVVERVHGCHVFPDISRAWRGRGPAMALHRACSTAASCGAPDADPTLKVSVDAFEPYLEPA